MNHDIYLTSPNPEVDALLEEMRRKIAPSFGVTLVGNRLTLRWSDKIGMRREAHMVILSVDDGHPEPEETGQ